MIKALVASYRINRLINNPWVDILIDDITQQDCFWSKDAVSPLFSVTNYHLTVI